MVNKIAQALEKETRKSFRQNLLKQLKKDDLKKPYGYFVLKKDLEFVVSIIRGEKVPPTTVEIQPSSTCNVRCKHCYARKTIGNRRLPNKLSEETMEVILEKILSARKNGFAVKHVKFVGTCGDPLVFPWTVNAVDKCKKKGRKVTIYTNGVGLSYSLDGRKYYEMLKHADIIHISLDAGSEEVLRKVKRVEGEFERILESIGALAKLRKGLSEHLNIDVSYVISEHNYEDIAEAARRVREAGADNIYYRRDMVDESKMTDERAATTSDQLRKALEYNKDSFQVIFQHSEEEMIKPSEKLNFKTSRCFIPYIWMIVGSDGKIYPCGHRGGDFGWNLGNLIEQEFEEILISPEREKRIKNLPDKDCVVCSPFMNDFNDLMTYLEPFGKYSWLKEEIKATVLEYEMSSN